MQFITDYVPVLSIANRCMWFKINIRPQKILTCMLWLGIQTKLQLTDNCNLEKNI